jgi:peptide/nickel transport system ATP-binding protein
MTPVLELQDLHVRLRTPDGPVHPVNGLSLALEEGQVHGLVGESGSGKSMAMLAVMGLAPPSAELSVERLRFDGRDLAGLSERELAKVRGRRIAMIFQDPMSSLNPLMRVGDQIAEALQTHLGHGRSAARRRAAELLGEVGIPEPERRARQYPHEHSGGMRQRAMIALALSCEPALLIADEPTTALDVTVQAQILQLLRSLAHERDMALLLITHDLGVVAEVCSTVTVMYGGTEVESGDVASVLRRPRHPYTRGLIASLPTLDPDAPRELQPIPGTQHVLRAPLTACPFADRCPRVLDRCRAERPPLTDEGRLRYACVNPAPEPDREAAP